MKLTNDEMELMEILRERPDLISYALRLVEDAAARSDVHLPAEAETD